MPKITFHVVGVKELESALQGAVGATRKGAQKLVKVHSETIANDAKTRAPSGVGSFLRTGVTAEYTADKLGAHIGAKSRYAPYVGAASL